MKDNPCNCSTCDFGTKREVNCPGNPHIFVCSKWNNKWMSSQNDGGWTFFLGCLSHSQAREYLMKDILTYLEQKEHLHIGSAPIMFVDEVITLIRDGVKE